jgi:hypothetical protein
VVVHCDYVESLSIASDYVHIDVDIIGTVADDALANLDSPNEGVPFQGFP